MSSELIFVAKWEYQDAEFNRMISDVDTAKAKVSETSESMGTDFLKTAGNVAHLTTAFMSLESVVSRVQQGQMGMAEATLRMIPSVVSLTSAIASLVTAQQARAIFTAIASAVETFGGSTPLLVAAATAAGLALTAVIASIPTKHTGGYGLSERLIRILPNETILPPGVRPGNVVNINVYSSGGDGHKIGRDILTELRAGGYA